LLGNDQNAISSWEFGWDEIWVRTCTECGTGVNDDDVYIGADHEDYCQNCFYNLFDTCSTCGETHWQVDVTYIDGDLYCDDCRDHRFTFCDGCGDYVPHSANVRLNEETQEWECDNCAEGA
jgi:formylmethanofuran dehydrogenase subunit E